VVKVGLVESKRAFEEMDMRIGEAWEHDAAAGIDDPSFSRLPVGDVRFGADGGNFPVGQGESLSPGLSGSLCVNSGMNNDGVGGNGFQFGRPKEETGKRGQNPTLIAMQLIPRLRPIMARVAQETSKRGRSIDPQNPGFLGAGVRPAMLCAAFEIKTVALLQSKRVAVIQRDFQAPANDIEKLLAFVSVGFAAIRRRSYAEQMWLHDRVAPGQQLHPHARAGFQDLALARTDATGIGFVGIEERKNVKAIEPREPAKRGDGGAHLAALKRGEKSNRNVGGAGDAGERVAAAQTQAPESRADGTGLDALASGGGKQSLGFEHVNDGRGVHAASAAEELSAFEEPHVGMGIEAVAAAGAGGSNESEMLPGAQDGGRNADQTCDITDAQEAVSGRGFQRAGSGRRQIVFLDNPTGLPLTFANYSKVFARAATEIWGEEASGVDANYPKEWR